MLHMQVSISDNSVTFEWTQLHERCVATHGGRLDGRFLECNCMVFAGRGISRLHETESVTLDASHSNSGGLAVI